MKLLRPVAFEIDKYGPRAGDSARHGLRIQDFGRVCRRRGRVKDRRLVDRTFSCEDVYLGRKGRTGKPIPDLSEDGMTAVLVIGGGGFEERDGVGVPITVTLVDGNNAGRSLINPPSGLGAAAPDEHSLLVICYSHWRVV